MTADEIRQLAAEDLPASQWLREIACHVAGINETLMRMNIRQMSNSEFVEFALAQQGSEKANA